MKEDRISDMLQEYFTYIVLFLLSPMEVICGIVIAQMESIGVKFLW